MGIRFDAGGNVDRQFSPDQQRHLRFVKGTNERIDLKKEQMLQRASKYVKLRNENSREAPDYLAMAKARIGT